MAREYLLADYPGILINKGEVSTLSETAIDGDMHKVDGVRYAYLDGTWEEILSTSSIQNMLDNSLSGYVTDSELDAVVLQLTDSLQKNGSELSIGERNTVIEMVSSAIEDAEHVTVSDVATMIETALASLETPLTEEQIDSIISESISGIEIPNEFMATSLPIVPEEQRPVDVRMWLIDKPAGLYDCTVDRLGTEFSGYPTDMNISGGALIIRSIIHQSRHRTFECWTNATHNGSARVWRTNNQNSRWFSSYQNEGVATSDNDFVTKKEIAGLASGSMTSDEVTATLNQLRTSLTSNTELTTTEINTAISDIQTQVGAIGNITVNQLQTIINGVLAGLGLTQTETQEIINESLSGISQTIIPVPDYANDETWAIWNGTNASFFPSGEFIANQIRTGTSITAQKTGSFMLYYYARTDTPTTVGVVRLFINGTNVSVSRPTPTNNIFSSTFDLFDVNVGDVISMSIQSDRDMSLAIVGAYIYFFPVKAGTNTANQQDLSNFITQTQLMTTTVPIVDNIDTHKITDRFRWQDEYDTERESIIRDAHNDGLKPYESVTVTVPASNDPYTVNDEAGGVIGITFRNTETTFTTILINGIEKYSSDGLTVNVPVTKYYWLRKGDVLESINAETWTYTPFTVDPESRIAIMQDSINALMEQTKQNRNDILDIKAAISNLQPDTDNTVTVVDMDSSVDITNNGTFTVTSTLGGRLNGEGYTLLGLLGVKLVATGYVDVNGNREYDNTALIGASVPALVVDVKNGDVIQTEGMKNLIFVPYIAKVGS